MKTDQPKPTGERQICSPQNPKPNYADGRWAHTNAHEVHNSQQNGWPSGDTIRVKCDDCGEIWTEELPQ